MSKHSDELLKQIREMHKHLPDSLKYPYAIRRWLEEDEVISHSQIVGKAWNLGDPDQVDDLVDFLDRAVRGVNAVLEGGLPSATGREAVQELAVSEVQEEVQQSGPSVWGYVWSKQESRQTGGDEADGNTFLNNSFLDRHPPTCTACIREEQADR